MNIFDRINPFRKKEDDFSLGPIDNSLQMPPVDPMARPNMDNPGQQFEHGLNDQNSFSDSQQPLDDHRMQMPLGENIRQGRMSAMHQESSEEEYPKYRHENPLQKDLELISSKLDYLKASLDAVNQRLANIEHLTKQEMENRKW